MASLFSGWLPGVGICLPWLPYLVDGYLVWGYVTMASLFSGWVTWCGDMLTMASLFSGWVTWCGDMLTMASLFSGCLVCWNNMHTNTNDRNVAQTCTTFTPPMLISYQSHPEACKRIRFYCIGGQCSSIKIQASHHCVIPTCKICI